MDFCRYMTGRTARLQVRRNALWARGKFNTFPTRYRKPPKANDQNDTTPDQHSPEGTENIEEDFPLSRYSLVGFFIPFHHSIEGLELIFEHTV